jgi:hypothetical protein
MGRLVNWRGDETFGFELSTVSVFTFKLSQKLVGTRSNPDCARRNFFVPEFVSVDSDVLEVAAGDLSIVGWCGQGGGDKAGEHNDELHFDFWR